MITYNEMIKNINIILADDDEDYLLMTYTFLKQLGYNVDKVKDGTEVIEALKYKDYQIALLDYFMPSLNGEEVIKKIRETNNEMIIILQTGFSGQKPPIETMKNLNIQNYFDKTDGIDKLNLELISAVKIFMQQNEIELSRFKQNAIGSLINGIAQEIKNDLLSVSGSIELTTMLINETDTNKEEVKKLNEISLNSKNTLLNIDKILTSIIKQNSSDEDSVMEANDIYNIINLILNSSVREKEINFDSNISLRPNSYLKGNVNDVIYLICEIIKNIINESEKGTNIKFSFTEDESNWLFNINSDKVSKLSNSFICLIKMVMTSIKNTDIFVEDNAINISMLKTL